MTPEAQRMAIAEACGWSVDDPETGNYMAGCDCKGRYGAIPDYLTDLNAMHKAEKVLNFTQRRRYHVELQNIFSRPLNGSLVMFKECITSTAAQRAEAFLRTLNLWTSP